METEISRLDRALRALSAGNRTLLRATGEEQLLQDMCEVIVGEGGYARTLVGYAQDDLQKSIRVMAIAGIDRALPMDGVLSWSEEGHARSASGTAVFTGRPSVGRMLPGDTQYDEGLRNRALEQGHAATSAFPLIVDGTVIGHLTMSARDPNAFDEQEVKLLAELADDLSFGIANLRLRARNAQAEATILQMAYFDTLTGLPNRARLIEQLGAAIESARAKRQTLAVLVVSVGRYHEICETLGFREGDALLAQTAYRLSSLLRNGDLMARVGEAKFAVVLPRQGAAQASQTAREVWLSLNEPLALAGLEVVARGGIGIALFPGHGTDPEILLRRARMACYHSKGAADGYMIYAGSMDRDCGRRIELMGDLSQAIEHNELMLYCQPKVNIASNGVSGVEALLRWKHPKHGLMSTMEFIKLAEQAGMITPLTYWMLDAAFSQSYTWQEQGLALPLSINLSAHDLRDPGLIDRIKGLFSTWGVRPDLIQFELTESALMEDPAAAAETLKRLKQLEVELFVDDFGTGYSSLAYLQQLPVDSIKIDQSFVMPMLANNDSATIVRSTIDLGHNLDLEVVAEGVETQDVLNRLAALGCDVAQGFLISRPMPPEAFDAWANQWREH